MCPTRWSPVLQPLGSVCDGGGGRRAALTLSWPGPQERYYVLYVRPSRIHRRKFDPKGNEIEPNFSATRKVNTGFLMSSYSMYPLPSAPRALLHPQGFPLSPGVSWPLKSIFSAWLALKPMSGLRAPCCTPSCPPFTQGTPRAWLAFPTPAVSCSLVELSRDPAPVLPASVEAPVTQVTSTFLPEFSFGPWAHGDFSLLPAVGGRRTSAVCLPLCDSVLRLNGKSSILPSVYSLMLSVAQSFSEHFMSVYHVPGPEPTPVPALPRAPG